ncbi:hypothetical protein FQA47_015193 [Oryzias melastigma]|uniref:Uncharacterized protein n=1 Tax=Oryzias melastigma TaxID=30732 RepID=A0A834BRV3_ORYME|nr:hypothetical protein FQA47_015193 [Oryzias melastigma]
MPAECGMTTRGRHHPQLRLQGVKPQIGLGSCRFRSAVRKSFLAFSLSSIERARASACSCEKSGSGRSLFRTQSAELFLSPSQSEVTSRASHRPSAHGHPAWACTRSDSRDFGPQFSSIVEVFVPEERDLDSSDPPRREAPPARSMTCGSRR